MGRGQVGAFPKRLKAILKAKGGHIEHIVSGRGTCKSSCSHAVAEAPLVADTEDWQKKSIFMEIRDRRDVHFGCEILYYSLY